MIIPKKDEEILCELGLIFIRLLRPEIAIMGADLHEYGPFIIGEVVAIPYVNAMIFVAHKVAEIYNG